ncbi:hypothetical protein D3C87_2091860 [compost metagenome]
MVPVEVVVLDRDDRFLKVARDVAEGDDFSVLLAVDVGEQVSLRVVDPGRFGGHPAFERLDVRQA